MSDSNQPPLELPIDLLRAHADLGLRHSVDDAMVLRLRRQVHTADVSRTWAMRHALTTRVSRSRRLIALPGGIAVLILLGVAVGVTGGSRNASAAAAFSVLRLPPGATAPADNPVLREARSTNHGLRIAAAREVLSDKNGKLWLMPGADGDVCLVQQPSAAGQTRIGFAGGPDTITLIGPAITCNRAAEAARRGIFVGVPGPGRWEYGVTPDGVTPVKAVVNGRTVSLRLTNGGFRVPPDATALTVGGLRIYGATERSPAS
jgi:hypothetical protein